MNKFNEQVSIEDKINKILSYCNSYSTIGKQTTKPSTNSYKLYIDKEGSLAIKLAYNLDDNIGDQNPQYDIFIDGVITPLVTKLDFTKIFEIVNVIDSPDINTVIQNCKQIGNVSVIGNDLINNRYYASLFIQQLVSKYQDRIKLAVSDDQQNFKGVLGDNSKKITIQLVNGECTVSIVLYNYYITTIKQDQLAYQMLKDLVNNLTLRI